MRKLYYFKPNGEKVDQAEGQRIIIREDGRVEQACDHGVGVTARYFCRCLVISAVLESVRLTLVTSGIVTRTGFGGDDA